MEAEPLTVTLLLDEEIHESFLEVINRELRQVVTVIEVLSPFNKVPGARGQGSFQRKRQEILASPCHWVEIDLLRQGQPSIPRDCLPPHHYTVQVSSQEKRPRALVWPIRLPQHLPPVPIPLRKEDPAVMLPLQQVLTTVYDRAAYDLQIDYRAEPRVPLEPVDAEWLRGWLQGKGLR